MTASPFLDEATRAAIAAPGRQHLVVAGFATEAVVLHTVRDAIAAGYQVYVPVDACGGMSSRTEDTAFRQIEVRPAESCDLRRIVGHGASARFQHRPRREGLRDSEVAQDGIARLSWFATMRKKEGLIMTLAKRTVIGPNADKKSAILYRDSPNEQDVPNVARRSTLWAATELPIDNSIKGDPGAEVTNRNL